MIETENTPAPGEDREKSDVSPALLKLTTTVRTTLLNAVSESPADRRLRRLKEGLESGEISEAFDGQWVVMCYEEQRQMDIDDPCITKTDTRNGAIVLTLDDMRDIVALRYLDPTGKDIVIDDLSMEEGRTAVLVVFPDEIGARKQGEA